MLSLLKHAAAGDLHKPDVLTSQARRLLRDPRVRGLATEFAGNWLDCRRFEEHNAVDRERFPSFTNELRQAMFEEPIRYFVDVAQRDRSVLDLIYGNDTFVNPVLGEALWHPDFRPPPLTKGGPGGGYWEGADEREMPEVPPGRRDLPVLPTLRRGGGGGLGCTSKTPIAMAAAACCRWRCFSPKTRRACAPVRSSAAIGWSGGCSAKPFHRRRRPCRNFRRDEANLGQQTLAQLLARHRADKACAGCHRRFDAVGLVFEDFGPIGERRDKDLSGHPVETQALFPMAGSEPACPACAITSADKRQDDFVDNLCKKLLSYALGRTLILSDRENACGDARPG